MRRPARPSRMERAGSVLVTLGFFTVVAVAFLGGIAAGRHWPDFLPSLGSSARAEREAAARRQAERERERAERAPELTFYQELTAPLAPAAPAPRAKPVSSKTAAETLRADVPSASPRTAPVAGVARATGPAGGPASPLPPPEPRAARAGTGRRDDGGPEERLAPSEGVEVALPPPRPSAAGVRYTVQVGAFNGREPADALRARLAAAGFDAYVAENQGGPGARYRVRVGSYATRDEARRVVERLGAQRLSAYVTTR